MKTTKFLTISAIALTLSMNNIAFSKPASKWLAPAPVAKSSTGFNVAVVDIQKVVESSPAISALKIDRKNKIEDLAKFIEKARADVAKESDATKKKALEDKYNQELNTRKNDIDNDYAQKLSDIDVKVTALIKSKARELGYNLTLPKTSVLDGGVDITSEIIKGLK